MNLPFTTHREVSFGGHTTSNFIHGKDINSINKITESDYQDIENYNHSTLYIVQSDNEAIKLYLGTTPVRADIPIEASIELERVATSVDYHDMLMKTTIIPQMIQIQNDIQALKENLNFVVLSQTEYNAIEEPNPDILYILT